MSPACQLPLLLLFLVAHCIHCRFIVHLHKDKVFFCVHRCPPLKHLSSHSCAKGSKCRCKADSSAPLFQYQFQPLLLSLHAPFLQSLIFDEVDLSDASVAESSTKNVNNSFTVSARLHVCVCDLIIYYRLFF